MILGNVGGRHNFFCDRTLCVKVGKNDELHTIEK